MANVEMRFICNVAKDDYITTKCLGDKIEITSFTGGDFNDIVLDISTAIKFAKTLRTEINKAKEEVKNG